LNRLQSIDIEAVVNEKGLPSMRLKGKTVLVTGGAAGIGQEIVRVLARQGARVISVDWNGAENERTTAEVCAAGGECVPVQGDVSVAVDVQRAFEISGPVDILVNNAACARGDGFLLDVAEDTWDKILAVCLKSVYLCSKAALPSMLQRKAGSIVNISSVNALTGVHLVAYTAAKGGIISLTRVLAAQYGAYGVRINTICPGTILSESSRLHYEAHPEVTAELKTLYPARTFGSTGDIASAVLFLASDEASFINGAIIPVDGGLTAVRQLPSILPKP
jgi:NAD(P)-dependent dehydrogenase (short-subunit alcohol dehydrogenase family)